MAESPETGHRAATRSVFVNVAPFDVRLEIGEVKATSASLRWFGADRNRQIYQILMRPDSVGHRLGYAGTVTPSMDEFHLRDLQPNTAYVACLAYESPSTSRFLSKLFWLFLLIFRLP